MSSNNPHITITRSNYEETFLLYVDGELDESGMASVEAFVLLHPDLQEELDLLLSTKLDSEVIVLEGKEDLLAAQMRLDCTDENLLLYIDDELTLEQKAAVEEKIARDEEYRFSYSSLAAAKLSSDEVIPYPNKKELYRYTEKRIAPKLWLRIAAAVILLIGISVLWINTKSNDTDPSTEIANTLETKGIEKDSSPIQPITTEPVQQEIAMQSPVTAEEKKDVKKTVTSDNKSIREQSPIPVPDQRDRVIALHEPVTDHTTISGDATERTLQQQTINNPTVTTTVTPAYTTIDGDAKTETGFSHAVATSNDDKKGSVRGFLRKASRFIERRTGINPVNEDDELLIGAVALKLK